MTLAAQLLGEPIKFPVRQTVEDLMSKGALTETEVKNFSKVVYGGETNEADDRASAKKVVKLVAQNHTGGFTISELAEACASIGIHEDAKQVSAEILRQLGGNKFIVMTGAKNLSYGDHEGKPSLTFKIPRNASKANYVRISLNGKDLYDVEFLKISISDYKTIKTYNDVYSDKLKEIFTKETGMYTSLGTMGEAINSPTVAQIKGLKKPKRKELDAEGSVKLFEITDETLDKPLYMAVDINDESVHAPKYSFSEDEAIKEFNKLVKGLSEAASEKGAGCQNYDDSQDVCLDDNECLGKNMMEAYGVAPVTEAGDEKSYQKFGSRESRALKDKGFEVKIGWAGKRAPVGDKKYYFAIIKKGENKYSLVISDDTYNSMRLHSRSDDVTFDAALDEVTKFIQDPENESKISEAQMYRGFKVNTLETKSGFWPEIFHKGKGAIGDWNQPLKTEEEAIAAAKKEIDNWHKKNPNNESDLSLTEGDKINKKLGRFSGTISKIVDNKYGEEGDKNKGHIQYGFVKVPKLKDSVFFAPKNNYSGTPFDQLKVGDKVSVEVGEADRGLIATSISKQGGSAPKKEESLLAKQMMEAYGVSEAKVDWSGVDDYLNNGWEHAEDSEEVVKQLISLGLDKKQADKIEQKWAKLDAKSRFDMGFKEGAVAEWAKTQLGVDEYFNSNGAPSLPEDEVEEVPNGTLQEANRAERIQSAKDMIAKTEERIKNAEEKLKAAKEKSDKQSIEFWTDRVKTYKDDLELDKNHLRRVQQPPIFMGPDESLSESEKVYDGKNHGPNNVGARVHASYNKDYSAANFPSVTGEITKHRKGILHRDSQEYLVKSEENGRERWYLSQEIKAAEPKKNESKEDTDLQRAYQIGKAAGKAAKQKDQARVNHEREYFNKLADSSSATKKDLEAQYSKGYKEENYVRQVESLSSRLLNVCESASYDKNAGLLDIGDDLEVGDIEFHRFATSIRATDVSNAGKRGKTAKEVSLYTWGGGSDDQAPIEALIPYLLKAKNIDYVEAMFKEVSSKFPQWKVQTTLHKGVDVFRKLGNQVDINNGKLRVTASPKNVSFEDLTDKNNNMSGYVNDDKKTELKKAWEVISKNKDNISKMTYLEFRRLLDSAGVRYRTYAGMD